MKFTKTNSHNTHEAASNYWNGRTYWLRKTTRGWFVGVSVLNQGVNKAVWADAQPFKTKREAVEAARAHDFKGVPSGANRASGILALAGYEAPPALRFNVPGRD